MSYLSRIVTIRVSDEQLARIEALLERQQGLWMSVGHFYRAGAEKLLRERWREIDEREKRRK